LLVSDLRPLPYEIGDHADGGEHTGCNEPSARPDGAKGKHHQADNYHHTAQAKAGQQLGQQLAAQQFRVTS
jgi:hypothetical protein